MAEVQLEDQSNIAASALGRLQVTDIGPTLLPTTKVRQLTVLISSFLTVFLTIGLNQAYGVFLGYYVDPNPREPFLPLSQTENTAVVAFVGTLGAGLTWAGSIFVNPLMSRTEDFRYITVAGACLISSGYILAGSCNQIWQLLLCQGLMYGMGSSMLYFPILSVAPEYFDTHRGSAMGFILSGAGFGGLIFSPVTRVLLSHLGIRWTLRTLGFLNLAISLPIAFSVRPSRSRLQRPTLVNVGLAKKPTFILQAFAAMAQAAGNFVPLTFLPQFSTRLGYTAAFGAILLAINNGVNSISRILMGLAADRVGRQNTLVLSVLGSAITVPAFWFGAAVTDGKALWIAFVIFYGVFSGGYNALFPTTVIDVFGTQAYASVNGFIYFIRGLGALWGSPVGGKILGEAPFAKSYVTLIWYDFALLLISSVCVFGVRGFDALDKGHFSWRA